MNLRYSLKIITPIILLFFVVFSWAAYYFFSEGTTKDHQSILSSVDVKVFTITDQNVKNTISAMGSLSAKQSITITPEIAGKIEPVLFQYGQMVKKGQPLYQLDDQLFRAQYSAAQSDLHLSQLTYQRNLQLIRQNAISKQALDKVRSTYQDKKSELRVLQVKLNKMLIKAPFPGVIGASKVDGGQYVSVGEPLVKLVDKADLIAKFSISEQYLDQVKVGQQVIVRSSAFAKQTFTGSVVYVSPTVNSSSRTVMLWANIGNPNLLLAPGLFVHVALTIGVKKNAILIPQEALIPTVEGNDVYVIKKNKAYKHSVKVLQIIGNKVQIIKGLRIGDTVVALGQEKLVNGRTVKVLSS